MFAFDDFIIVIYRARGAILVDYINANKEVFTGVLKANATSEDNFPRSIVQFNKYEEAEEIVNGSYVPKRMELITLRHSS